MAVLRITGDKELDRKLAALGKKAKPLLRKAARRGAALVRDTAKAMAPVEEGTLEASIKVRAMKRSRKNKNIVGASVVSGGDNFTGDQYYGSFQEFGTAFIPPDPFMRPAKLENEDPVKSVFNNAVRELIKDV